MKLSSANINVMVKACRKAAKNIIRDFGEIENLQVNLKGPGDFVTASDIKAEKILIEELQKARPRFSILSEEIGQITNDEEFKWIIDPIDGTANFLHGIPHFAISLGLEHKKEIICGIIFDPIKNEMSPQESIDFEKKYKESEKKWKKDMSMQDGLKLVNTLYTKILGKEYKTSRVQILISNTTGIKIAPNKKD